MYATLPAAAPVAVGRVRTPGPRSNAPMNPVKAAVPPALGGRALADEALAGPVPGSGLRGRRGECEALDRLVADVQAGQGQVLVLRGEAGAGKTALLEYLLERASGCCRARTAGVESEMELAFAGLHQLCAPFLDRIERLPGPQREALSTAFNLRDGATPDRFAVGLAVLSLLSEVAGERPLVWVVDDAHWLDRASAQALTFVARRLADKPAAVVFAVREPGGRAGCWWYAASPGWARQRYWIVWPGWPRAAGWCTRPGCSRRWNWRSPGCISCARRCWITWRRYRCRSVTRSGSRWASVPVRHRTGSWSDWPC